MRRLIASALLGLSLLVAGCGRGDTPPAQSEAERIQSLIRLVESGNGVRAFIRNGVAYTPQEGADHLRSKLGQAGSRITTLQDFILKVASASSLSGRPYLVELEDGRTIEARAWYIEQGY